MYWIVIIAFACLTLFLVWASADVGSGIYLKSLCKGRTADKVVAITFDDGPDKEMTPRILDTLRKHDVKATFFLIGSKVTAESDIVTRITEEGHIVANHTYSHSGLFPLSSSCKVNEELEMCDKAIMEATGKSPKLFRPPFGVTNPIIGKAVRKRGYKTIGWSIRSLDTIKSRKREEVCKKVIKNLHPGAIILLHERCEGSDELVNDIITAIHRQGYRFVSLDKMLKIDAYEN